MKCSNEIFITYKSDNELYYLKNKHAVYLYKNNRLVDKARIWYDAEEDDRPYILINYTVVYLDTLRTLKPINTIIDEICDEYSVTYKDLQSPARTMNVVEARHLLFFILREKYKLSLEEIGEMFGNRTHATVISGIKKIEGYCFVKKHYRDYIKLTLDSTMNNALYSIKKY